MSTSVSLKDQMGAMSLIDSLRHRQQQVQDHLDLPKVRAEVARRISEYYQSSGIVVDAETIDSGVREYFSKRLTFEMPEKSRIRKVLEGVYMARGRHAKNLAVSLAATAAVFGGISFYNNWSDARELAGYQQQVRTAATHSSNLRKQMESQEKELAEMKARVEAQNRVVFTQMQKQAEATLEEIKAIPDDVVPAIPTTLEAGRKLNLTSVSNGKRQLGLSENFHRIATLKEMLPVNVAYAEAKVSVEGQDFDKKSQKRMDALLLKADTFINDMKAQEARTTINSIREMVAFSNKALTLRVVDRKGQRSGVERTYNESGGKSWYLIVEAIDGSGSQVPVIATSAETGEHRSADMFGVRVSETRYNEIKADKLADGHVDDSDMGDKPAKSLNFNFKGALGDNPDIILEW